MLRCPSPVALVGAILAIGLGFSLEPTPTHAAAVNPNATTATATYRLTTNTSLPVPDANIQGPQVVALISPAKSVVPPTLADGSQGSPLTVLSDSKGFDASHLVVALKDGTSASGQPEQMFGLVFFGQGLQPGGVLHFALSIDKSLASNPPVLQSQTPGITITSDTPATPPNHVNGGGGVSIPSTNVSSPSTSSAQNSIPEPLSVVLWSTVLVGVVARRHLLRRPRSL